MLKYVLAGVAIFFISKYFTSKKKAIDTANEVKEEKEEIKMAEPAIVEPNPEEIARIEAKMKAEEEKRRIEKEKLRLEVEKQEREHLESLQNSTTRVYFSYSLTNEHSPVYCIDPYKDNSIIEASETSLSELYKDGWRIKDIDKTGQSAQIEDFNFLIRLSKD